MAPRMRATSGVVIPILGRSQHPRRHVDRHFQKFASSPSDIVAAVVRGTPMVIARERLIVEAKPVPVRRAVLRQRRARSPVGLKSYGATNLNDQKSFGLHEMLEDKAARNYRRGLAAHLCKQPQWNCIVVQARKLIDLLP